MKRWLVTYGSEIKADDLAGVDLAILEPNAITPDRARYPRTKFIGYLSVGEIAPTDPRWWEAQGGDFLIEPNPVWKGWRVDIRSPRWRKLLLDRWIPEILQKGYDGLFLDTVDTATFLESKDPKKFRGSREAMVKLVKEIRRRFPKIMILPNNALELLPRYGREIDGIVVEELHVRYDFETKTSRKIGMEEIGAHEKILDEFRATFGKPVYNIIYESSPSTGLARFAIGRSESKGYLWYVTTVDLMKVGTVSPP